MVHLHTLQSTSAINMLHGVSAAAIKILQQPRQSLAVIVICKRFLRRSSTPNSGYCGNGHIAATPRVIRRSPCAAETRARLLHQSADGAIVADSRSVFQVVILLLGLAGREPRVSPNPKSLSLPPVSMFRAESEALLPLR